MDKILTLEEISAYIAQIRNLRKGYISNFFLDPQKHEEWVESSTFFEIGYGETHFLIKKEEGFLYLFYISTNIDSLKENLPKVLSELSDNVIVDLVGIEPEINLVQQVFSESGFNKYQSLFRMIRTGNPDYNTIVDSNICVAGTKEAAEVYQLLHCYFDPKAEQLPSILELNMHAKEGNLLVYKYEGTVIGFIMFELTKVSFYLRYWFVHPDFREQKIASKLYYTAMEMAKDTKRQMLWILADNENAHKRYEHYGYQQDKMKDIVLIKR